MTKTSKIAACGFMLALSILSAGCLSALGRPKAAEFIVPIESRLILQVPFFVDENMSCGPAALASVMTYNGRPVAAESAALNLTADSRGMGRDMVIWARREGLKADFYAGAPENLVECVRQHKPIIVRLDQAAPPVEKGSYAVIVGYNPDGPVVNSCSVNQQILPWSDFLAAWHKAGYFTVLIEPL
jgi:ABC-type bacteriocin/lantibiotic exporter with double-glycine peptidase domain